jgi:hypothetical protein
MKASKTLVSVISVCPIPFTGLVFIQKADAYQIPVRGWPTQSFRGICTTFINVSSSGRDSWYWEVECGRNHSRRDYLKAKRACWDDYRQRDKRHTHFQPRILIQPYAHNKCY